jgi:predicted metal-binding membrane protein
LVAAIAWTVTINRAGTMSGGTGTMGLSLMAFLALWVVMMAAMMFPSAAPMALVWIRSIAVRPTPYARVAGITSFLAGYLFSWTTFGVAVYFVLLGTGRLTNDTPSTTRWVGAAVLVLAAIYQLTSFKATCLRHCRTPFGSLIHYSSYRGPARDLYVGSHHGAYCVGCCWGLMIVLVAVGAMNVVAMLALTVVIFIEKVWRHGQAFSRAIGVLLLGVAVLSLLFPQLLAGLGPSPMTSM